MATTKVAPGPPPPNAGLIVNADLREEMSRSYTEYAMSVILGRALPDLRDGLKPVHRRILYAMYELRLGSSSRYRKCARVVGEVLGKYHPHGDKSVYDALVRMAQPFSMGLTLVDGHGNFGSNDGDAPAAMRYTECRLAGFSKELMLEDIERETVKFAANFDASENEPLVLPAQAPNLFLNGSSGIAVGMATNIPPHNMTELTDALKVLIDRPNITDEELLEFVPAPDFPTGGQILGLQGSREMYLTGKGKVMMRSKTHFETLKIGRKFPREAIIVTELPFQTVKSSLVAHIAELVNDKKLEGISDLRDESDRNGMRIVIELKRDAEPKIVLNNLFNKTNLMTSFAGNLLALDNGQVPKTVTLRFYFERFLEFRRECVTKRTQFELTKAKNREHLVQGFLKAQKHITAIVKTIRASKTSNEALEALMSTQKLSERQAQGILSMQLRRLTSLERDILEKEEAELKEQIDEYESILATPAKLDNIIKDELTHAATKHGIARRSEILAESELESTRITDVSLIPNNKSIVMLTENGYMKRMAVSVFEPQKRGTRGKRGIGGGDDLVQHFLVCNDHDTLIAISNRGVAYQLAAHHVPVGGRTAKGVPLISLLPNAQQVASIIAQSEVRDDEYFTLLTKNGQIKRTPVTEFRKLNRKGKRIISLVEDDELKWVRRCSEGDTVVITTKFGKSIRFRTNNAQLRASGCGSRGVRAIQLLPGDSIADMDVLPQDADKTGGFLIGVTSRGAGKRVKASDVSTKRRGGQGMIMMKFAKKKNLNEREVVIAMRKCDEEDGIIMMTENGTILRQKVKGISSQGRRTKGVRVQRLDDKDRVVKVAILPNFLVEDDE